MSKAYTGLGLTCIATLQMLKVDPGFEIAVKSIKACLQIHKHKTTSTI
jgi:hypothetical protein